MCLRDPRADYRPESTNPSNEIEPRVVEQVPTEPFVEDELGRTLKGEELAQLRANYKNLHTDDSQKVNRV